MVKQVLNARLIAKRVLIALLCCGLIISLLAGCGSVPETVKPDTQDTTSPEETPSEKHETEPVTENVTPEETEPTEKDTDPAEESYYKGLSNIQVELISVEIKEDMTEVYTKEESVTSVNYLGEYEGRLYFLGFSEADTETHKIHGLILSAARDPQGGKMEILTDLGLFYDECRVLKMIDGRMYLSINPQGSSDIIPEGGAFVSVGTDGSVEILKKYEGHYAAQFYEAGESIIFTRLPDVGETIQTLEVYNTKTREWEDSVQRNLSHEENKELYTGEWIYWAGGMNTDGYYFATAKLNSENPNESPAPQREAEIWWHDRKTGEDTLIMTADRQVSVTGDAHVLVLLWYENGNRKMTVSSVQDYKLQGTWEPSKKSFLNAFTMFAEISEGKYVINSPTQAGAMEKTLSYNSAAILDLKEGLVSCYEPSLPGWEIRAEFLSSDNQKEVICYMREELTTEQMDAGKKAEERILVFQLP